MLKLKRVAVTGGLSSGKTSVCRFFKELGAHVVNADQIVHTLLNPKTELGSRIVQLLGKETIHSSGPLKGQFDRKMIAEIVFHNPEKLQMLESLLHPAVSEQIMKEAANAENDPSTTLFVAEIPLLFESGNRYDNFLTIAVVADEKECLRRYIEKTNHSPEEFTRRMKRQLPQTQKAQNADYVIHNQGSLSDLQVQVEEIFKQLTSTP